VSAADSGGGLRLESCREAFLVGGRDFCVLCGDHVRAGCDALKVGGRSDAGCEVAALFGCEICDEAVGERTGDISDRVSPNEYAQADQRADRAKTRRLARFVAGEQRGVLAEQAAVQRRVAAGAVDGLA
jgi:hypothetical protein